MARKSDFNQLSFDFRPVFTNSTYAAKCGCSLSHANKLLNRAVASGKMVKEFEMTVNRSCSAAVPPPVRTAIYREIVEL